jgi:Acyl-CoA reductase (LuxC)
VERRERSFEERRTDVMRLVQAAGAVARDDAVVDALVESTGLSRQGVALALAEHLETHPTEAEVRRLVDGTGTAVRVHVVLSANVFVAPLRALAIARAAAPSVTVSASSREPVFTRALLDRANDPGLAFGELLFDAPGEACEVHLYGRDETILAIRNEVPASVRVRGHGSGFGVALATGRLSVSDAAFAIARDVIAFDQRGCLSPRVVIALGDLSDAEAYAVELDRALAELEEEVPRGHLDDEEREASGRYVSTMEYAGRVWRGKAHVVGLAPQQTPLWVPPTGRHVHVSAASSADAASALLSRVARFVTAVGSDEPTLADKLVHHSVRTSALGRMQKPPFDGPVDLRPG